MNVGLFFGSFNPIHNGHLMIASHLLDEMNLDAVWFVISPHNPHKDKSTLLADHHRLALVQLAIENQSKFKAEDLEFSLPQPSYTIDTLVRLKEKHPSKTFSLLMGQDNLRTFTKWKNYEQILDKHQIYVYPRIGQNGENEASLTHKNIIICENVPQLELSASLIRQKIKDKKSIAYLTPPAVEKYILEMHFYEK